MSTHKTTTAAKGQQRRDADRKSSSKTGSLHKIRDSFHIQCREDTVSSSGNKSSRASSPFYSSPGPMCGHSTRSSSASKDYFVVSLGGNVPSRRGSNYFTHRDSKVSTGDAKSKMALSKPASASFHGKRLPGGRLCQDDLSPKTSGNGGFAHRLVSGNDASLDDDILSPSKVKEMIKKSASASSKTLITQQCNLKMNHQAHSKDTDAVPRRTAVSASQLKTVSFAAPPTQPIAGNMNSKKANLGHEQPGYEYFGEALLRQTLYENHTQKTSMFVAAHCDREGDTASELSHNHPAPEQGFVLSAQMDTNIAPIKTCDKHESHVHHISLDVLRSQKDTSVPYFGDAEINDLYHHGDNSCFLEGVPEGSIIKDKAVINRKAGVEYMGGDAVQDAGTFKPSQNELGADSLPHKEPVADTSLERKASDYTTTDEDYDAKHKTNKGNNDFVSGLPQSPHQITSSQIPSQTSPTNPSSVALESIQAANARQYFYVSRSELQGSIYDNYIEDRMMFLPTNVRFGGNRVGIPGSMNNRMAMLRMQMSKRQRERYRPLWRPRKATIFFQPEFEGVTEEQPKFDAQPGSVESTIVSSDDVTEYQDGIVTPFGELELDDSWFPTEHRLKTSSDLNREMTRVRKFHDCRTMPRTTFSRRPESTPQPQGSIYYNLHGWFPCSTTAMMRSKYNDAVAHLKRFWFDEWRAEVTARNTVEASSIRSRAVPSKLSHLPPSTRPHINASCPRRPSAASVTRPENVTRGYPRPLPHIQRSELPPVVMEDRAPYQAHENRGNARSNEAGDGGSPVPSSTLPAPPVSGRIAVSRQNNLAPPTHPPASAIPPASPATPGPPEPPATPAPAVQLDSSIHQHPAADSAHEAIDSPEADCECRECSKAAHWINSRGSSCFPGEESAINTEAAPAVKTSHSLERDVHENYTELQHRSHVNLRQGEIMRDNRLELAGQDHRLYDGHAGDSIDVTVKEIGSRDEDRQDGGEAEAAGVSSLTRAVRDNTFYKDVTIAQREGRQRERVRSGSLSELPLGDVIDKPPTLAAKRSAGNIAKISNMKLGQRGFPSGPNDIPSMSWEIRRLDRALNANKRSAFRAPTRR